MIAKNSQEVVKGYSTSDKAKTENNDCVVKAMAAALELDYDTAHDLVRTEMKRPNRKGTKTVEIKNAMKRFSENGLEVAGMKFDVQSCSKDRVTNRYKLYGETVFRKKTVKSFIQSNPKGNFMVLVSRHAFAVKDGVLIDNKGEEFRPTRKVECAFEFSTHEPKSPVVVLK